MPKGQTRSQKCFVVEVYFGGVAEWDGIDPLGEPFNRDLPVCGYNGYQPEVGSEKKEDGHEFRKIKSWNKTLLQVWVHEQRGRYQISVQIPLVQSAQGVATQGGPVRV